MDYIKEAIVQLHKAGKSVPQIVSSLKPSKVSRHLVRRVVIRYRETGSTSDRPRSGRPPTASSKQNLRKIQAEIKKNPRVSIRKMAADLHLKRSSVYDAVRKKLKAKHYKLHTVHGLSEIQKKVRFQRSKLLKARFKNKEDTEVIFSDEKLFTIEQAVNRQNDGVWITATSTVDPEDFKVQRKQGAESLMVWAAVSKSSRSPLFFVEKGVKIDAVYYREQVLKNGLLPWTQKVFGNRHWVFQQDSAPAHKAKTTQQWLENNVPEFIRSSEWPPCSPDLNPLDFGLWSILESNACRVRHRNIDELKQALSESWDKIPQSVIANSCNAFFKRLSLVIKNKGNHIENW